MAKFGIVPDSTSTVYATLISTSDRPKTISENGQLEVSSAIDPFIFEHLFTRFACAIATERILLDKAAEIALSHSFLALKHRKFASSLTNWLSTPSSDSTLLINQVKLLRDGLALDARRSEVLNALNREVRSADIAIGAAFSLLVGGATTLAFLSGPSGSASPPTPLLIGLSMVSLLVGVLVRRATKTR